MAINLKKRKFIQDINSGSVVLAGWAEEIKLLGKISFITLRDVSGKCLLVLKKDMNKLSDLNRESVISIKGKVQNSKSKKFDKEILVEEIEILTDAEPLPIEFSGKVDTNIDKRLDWRFLDSRNSKTNAIFKIRSSIYKHVVDFYYSKNFTIVNTPKLTTIGLESGADSFVVNYFNNKAVLAQSPQFYKQMFVMGGFERVMEIGPVYRAEKSHTSRHLTEFTGVDFEMGFIKDENDIMDMIEEMFKYVLKKVKSERLKELNLLGIDLNLPKKIPRMDMKELKKVLSKKGKKLGKEDDLDSEAEKIIGKYVKNNFGEDFVFVTNYPFSKRPFYHMKPENNPRGTKSFDLLWNGVEIATGSQREHRWEVLKKQAKEKNIKIPKIYGNIFKHGSIPHGGVGFGLDRITQRLLNLENVREATLLPRDVERLTP